MTLEELKQIFDADNYDWCPDPSLMVSTRGDLNAFLLLDKLLPRPAIYRGLAPDLVSGAEHDKIWLNVDVDGLLGIVTVDQVKALSYFGVWFDCDTESLCMLV